MKKFLRAITPSIVGMIVVYTDGFGLGIIAGILVLIYFQL